MRLKTLLQRSIAACALVSLTITPIAANAAPAKPGARGRTARVAPLPAGVQRPTEEKWLSIGEGELITLPANIADVWTSNPGVADVYVNNARQIHLFGKEFGEATIFATNASGAVIFSTSVHVAQNSTSLDRMLKLAMPEANITVTTAGQLAVINGTVASPDDSAEAQRFVTAALNPGIDPSSGAALKIAVMNRLKTATPLQVNLQVRFAEVNRSFAKNVGVNLAASDATGGFKFGLGSGSRVPGTLSSEFTTLNLAGKLFGLDLTSAIDIGERNGQVTTLANPNLTALSGETGTFLAGGEIPIPIAQGLGAVSVEYKQYGISLAYTPTVLSDGRISLRVRPEVSQLDYSNAISVTGGGRVPGLTTRRAETTVELGSGQSFMIGGLLQNTHNNSITKAPFLGDVPILGALFRSNSFQRNETELMIIITPYLVKPVNPRDIVLPTDGYRAANDVERILLGQLSDGGGGPRPVPTLAGGPPAAPAIGAVVPAAPRPAPRDAKDAAATANNRKGAAPAPGFSIN